MLIGYIMSSLRLRWKSFLFYLNLKLFSIHGVVYWTENGGHFVRGGGGDELSLLSFTQYMEWCLTSHPYGPHLFFDGCDHVYTSPYYRQHIGHMNHWALFRFKLWGNVLWCISYYVLNKMVGTVRSRYIAVYFLPRRDIHNLHVRYGHHSCDHSLTEILPSNLVYCVRHRAIWYRDIQSIHYLARFIFNLFSQKYLIQILLTSIWNFQNDVSKTNSKSGFE